MKKIWYMHNIEAAKRLKNKPKKKYPMHNKDYDIDELVNPAGHKGPKTHKNKERSAWEAPAVTNPLGVGVFRSVPYHPLTDYYAMNLYSIKTAQLMPPMGDDPMGGLLGGGGDQQSQMPQGEPQEPLSVKKDDENPDYMWKFNIPVNADIDGSIAGDAGEDDDVETDRKKIEVFQSEKNKKYMIKSPEGRRIFLGKELKHVMNFVKSKWDIGMKNYLSEIGDMPRFTG